MQILTSPFPKGRKEEQNQFGLDLILTTHGSFIQRQEKALFTLEDLLGIVGGTIGLFCGFSILSLFEIMIYVGIKMIQRQGDKGEEKKDNNIKGTEYGPA